MRLEDPDNKLAIPIFTGSNHDNNNRFDPPPLTPTEIHSIKDVLNTNRLRRKAFSSGRIRVSVDGTERARFLAEGSRCQPFSIPLTASHIEVFGQDDDGELLLGILPLWDLEAVSDGQQQELSITAEGGQKIHCVISPQIDSKGEVIAGEARVDVTPAHSKASKLLSRWAKISRDCESGQPRRPKATRGFYPSKLVPTCLRLRREEGGRMKQTTDLSPLVAGMVSDNLSTLVPGMVSEVVAGVITGVTSARRLYYRNLLLTAIVVASITFAIAVIFRNYLPGTSVTPAHGNIPAPARDQRPEPTPRARDDEEEIRRLSRPNPM